MVIFDELERKEYDFETCQKKIERYKNKDKKSKLNSESMEIYIKFLEDKKFQKIKLSENKKHEIIIDKIYEILKLLKRELFDIGELLIRKKNKYENIKNSYGNKIIKKIKDSTYTKDEVYTDKYLKKINNIILENKEDSTKFPDFKPFVYKLNLMDNAINHLKKFKSFMQYLSIPKKNNDIIQNIKQEWITLEFSKRKIIEYFETIPSLPKPTYTDFGHKGLKQIYTDMYDPDHAYYKKGLFGQYIPDSIYSKLVDKKMVADIKERNLKFDEENKLLTKNSEFLLKNEKDSDKEIDEEDEDQGGEEEEEVEDPEESKEEEVEGPEESKEEEDPEESKKEEEQGDPDIKKSDLQKKIQMMNRMKTLNKFHN